MAVSWLPVSSTRRNVGEAANWKKVEGMAPVRPLDAMETRNTAERVLTIKKAGGSGVGKEHLSHSKPKSAREGIETIQVGKVSPSKGLRLPTNVKDVREGANTVVAKRLLRGPWKSLSESESEKREIPEKDPARI